MFVGALLVTVRELSDYINEPIDTDEDQAQATQYIRAASAKVRAAGDATWTRWNCPEIAWTVALEAAARGYQNPAGLDVERADTLNLSRHDMFAVGTTLTKEERELLAAETGSGQGIISVSFYRPDTMTESDVQ